MDDYGASVPFELLQLYSGLDGDQTLQLVAPDINARKRQEVLEAQRKMYETKYLGSVRAFTGFAGRVEALREGGGRIALATDCKGPELSHYRSLVNVDVEHG